MSDPHIEIDEDMYILDNGNVRFVIPNVVGISSQGNKTIIELEDVPIRSVEYHKEIGSELSISKPYFPAVLDNK